MENDKMIMELAEQMKGIVMELALLYDDATSQQEKDDIFEKYRNINQEFMEKVMADVKKRSKNK
jgi:hypothetical protein